MTDEEIRSEAEKIADTYIKHGLATEAIIALCTRVRDSQREADAQTCDGLASRLTYASSEHWRQKAAHGITAGDVETAARLALAGAAAAIRNKEQANAKD